MFYNNQLATAKQVDFAERLCAEIGRPFDRARAEACSKNDMSGHIRRLLVLKEAQQELAAEKPHLPWGGALARQTRTPDPRPVPTVPAGRYAIRDADGIVKFYKLDTPTEGRWAGKSFLSVQASDDFHRIRGDAFYGIMAQIAADPAAASKLYGQELGHCGVCGRTLTDETSRAYGIGPVCRERTGW